MTGSARPPRRYDLAPLADAMGEPLPSLGRRLNIGGSTWVEYRDQGVTARVADRLATKAGFHPSLVWPSWFEDEAAALSVECADERCDRRFVPAKRSQRYCSPRCRERRKAREKARRRYQNDPVYREAQLARVAAYRGEVDLTRARRAEYRRNAEVIRRRRRERYAADPERERQWMRDYRRRTRDAREGNVA